MDARKNRFAAGVAAMMMLAVIGTSEAAVYRTPNFVVTAPTKEFAEQVGKAAEFYRKDLAVKWLGKQLPKNWYRPCPISVRVGQIGAGGATSFQFDKGEVFGWKMNVQGTEERILDSVIPHEVSHMIFATHFRRPLPRWADEGAATIIEHESERMRQMQMLKQVNNNGTRYSLRQLMSIKEYPSSMQRVLTLYAQGYSLSDYLIQKKGRENFLEFLQTAHQHGWDNALRKHYKLKSIEHLEGKWDNWVMAGSPRLNLPDGHLLAADDRKSPEPEVYRGQSPEEDSEESTLGSVAENRSENPGAQSDSEQGIQVADPAESTELADAEEKTPFLSDAEIRLRGRREVLQSGWEPLSREEAIQRRSSVSKEDAERPPFAEDLPVAQRERPPFAEEVSMTRERPPFVE